MSQLHDFGQKQKKLRKEGKIIEVLPRFITVEADQISMKAIVTLLGAKDNSELKFATNLFFSYNVRYLELLKLKIKKLTERMRLIKCLVLPLLRRLLWSLIVLKKV